MPISSSAKTRLAPPGWPGRPWGSFAGKTPAAPPAVQPVQLEAHGPVHVPPYVEYVPTALYIEPLTFLLPSRWRVEVSDRQGSINRRITLRGPAFRLTVPPLAFTEPALTVRVRGLRMACADPVGWTEAVGMPIARLAVLTCDDALFIGERRGRIMSEIFELLGVR